MRGWPARQRRSSRQHRHLLAVRFGCVATQLSAIGLQAVGAVLGDGGDPAEGRVAVLEGTYARAARAIEEHTPVQHTHA